jgi:hypothetical protein
MMKTVDEEGIWFRVSSFRRDGPTRIDKFAIDAIACGRSLTTHRRSPSGSFLSSVFSKPFSIRMHSLYLARKTHKFHP